MRHIRFWLFIVSVCCLSFPAYTAAPTIDGSGFVSTTTTAVSSKAISVTTTSTNDVILLFIVADALGTAPTVSSVVGGSLTWHKRSSQAFQATNCAVGGGTSCGQDQEIWWAFSSGTLSSVSMTVTWNTTIDFATIQAVGVHGVANPAAPWDINVGFPVQNQNSGGSAAVLSSAFTTSQTDDLLIVLFSFGNTAIAGGDGPCTGWTGNSRHNSNRDDQTVGYKSVTTIQSAATVGWYALSPGACNSGTSQTPWQITVDALTSGPFPRSPVFGFP